MKKLVVLLLTVFMCSLYVVADAANIFVNPSYNTTRINKVRLTQLNDNIDDLGGTLNIPATPTDEVLTTIYKVAAKNNIEVIDERDQGIYVPDKNATQTSETDKLLAKRRGDVAKPLEVELRVEINKLGYKNYIIPAHWKTESYYVDHVWHDRHGKRHVDRERRYRDVWVPDEVAAHSYCELSYKVYDMETGALICSDIDNRDRDRDSDHDGMLNRNVQEFFKKLLKK